MEQSCRLYYIFVIFGYTICKVEAGLLDPITDILNPNAYPNQLQNGPYRMAMQFIPQFQGNNLVSDNSNFRPRDTRVPNRNSNVPYGDPNSSRLFYNNQINSRLPPDHPSNPKIFFTDSKLSLMSTNLKKKERKGGSTSIKLPAKHPSKPVIKVEDKTSSRAPSHNPDEGIQPVEIHNNGNAPESFENNQKTINGTTQDQLQNIISETTSDSDKLFDHGSPEAEKLLETLRKLNELKEQKQQEQQKQHKNITSFQTEPATVATIMHYNNDDIKELLKPIKSVDYGIAAPNQMKVIMKMLTKNKFYTRAQPVRPENERRHNDETIYYID